MRLSRGLPQAAGRDHVDVGRRHGAAAPGASRSSGRAASSVYRVRCESGRQIRVTARAPAADDRRLHGSRRHAGRRDGADHPPMISEKQREARRRDDDATGAQRRARASGIGSRAADDGLPGRASARGEGRAHEADARACIRSSRATASRPCTSASNGCGPTIPSGARSRWTASLAAASARRTTPARDTATARSRPTGCGAPAGPSARCASG